MSTLLRCLALACALLAAPSSHPAPAPGGATLAYRLTHERGEGAHAWRVELELFGWDRRAKELVLELPDWGEWTQAPAGHLASLESRPALARQGDGPRFVATPPRGWDGTLTATYVLRVHDRASETHRRHGLLPWHGADLAAGYMENVLLRPVGAEGVALERTLELVPPAGWHAFSGSGGTSEGPQRSTLDPRASNGLIAFGVPKAQLASEGDGPRVEVLQLGGSALVAERVLDLLTRLAPSYARRTGFPAKDPIRALVLDEGWGGTGTDHGLKISYEPRDTRHADSPYFANTVAHELFHDWLGCTLKPADGSTVWFHEGFTDYAAIRQLAATGCAPREWLSVRLLELEAEVRALSGAVDFSAGDTAWRTEPWEQLAYKGGALLAMDLDVELRARGHGGVLALVGELLDEGREFSQASLARLVRRHGLKAWYERRIVRGELPDPFESLQRAGFDVARRETNLTYFGIRLEAAKEGLGRVAALDPDGPNAARGLEVGDLVLSGRPLRARPLELADGVEVAYDFGLLDFEPVPDCTLVVRRGEEELEVAVEPWLSPGAVGEVLVPDEERLAAFLGAE